MNELQIFKNSDLEGIYNTLSTNSQSIVNIGRLIGANGEWDLKNGVLIFENGNISEIKNIEDDK